MSDATEQPAASPESERPPQQQESAAAPYLTILATALLVGVFLAAYVWLHRAEIVAILTQTPT